MPNKTNSREIRVFISSTFRDMQEERDYLVRQVFPAIRRACRERQVEFTEIDLRWGVTSEEAEHGKVVRICLEEINRCRPYFLSLLGERYGWAPVHADIDHLDELLELFPSLELSLKAGHSVTEMEILHGVLDNPDMDEHCFFYLRDRALTETLAAKSGVPGDYLETDVSAKEKLICLKDRIRESKFPVREGYNNIEEQGEWIKQDLLAVLDQRYPLDQTPSPLQAERLAHQTYARDRCLAYIANPEDLNELDTYNKAAGNSALVVTGASGMGKSALLSYWINQQRDLQPERFIIEHYVGISGDADPVAILRRIMTEINDRTGDTEIIPSKADDVIRDFPLWLGRVRANDPLLLVLDGLNQIEAQHSNWLPSFWPENVKAIFSVIPGEQLEALKNRNWRVWTVEPLTVENRKTLIKDWLALYRKGLSPEQIDKIASASACGNPLYLRTVLEELRIFGYFEGLDTRINGLLQAEDPFQLFDLVLDRLESDFGKDNVSQIMQGLWAARRGLSETELVGVTGLSRLAISTLLLSVDTHFARRGGLLAFFHDYLRQAVQQRYVPIENDQYLAHRKLAEYFNQRPVIDDRVAEELPWQWQQGQMLEKLKDCICDIEMFSVLYSRDENELRSYWLSLNALYDPGECYLESLEKWEKSVAPEFEKLIRILDAVGLFLMEIAHYASANHLIRRALAINEKMLGPEHSNTAAALNNLAGLLNNQGNTGAALPLCEQALAINEKVLGPEHPNTAASLSNLAELYSSLGNAGAALPLFERALAINEKVLGAEHPGTVNTMSNLAALYSSQGNANAALPLYERALAIREKTLGPEHPKTATSLNNLAGFFKSQGKVGAALPLFERALAINEKVRGPEHPDTAILLGNLADVFNNQGNFGAALPLFERALAINEKVLGAEHPDTANILSNLAYLFYNQGNAGAALPLYERALAINEKALGSEHPSTALSMNNLAGLYKHQGDFSAALPLYERALAINEKALGSEHPSTALSLNNLAALFNSQNDFGAAFPLYERALAINEKALGSEHPSTANSLNNLATLFHSQGDFSAALPLYERALAINVKALGSEHLCTAPLLNNLAELYRSQGEFSAALPLYERALAINEKALGSEHPNTVDSRSVLADIKMLLTTQ